MRQALRTFAQEHGGAPNLVVFSSNYWDIARMVLHESYALEEPAFQGRVLTWIAQANEVMTYLMVWPIATKQQAPATNIFVRTQYAHDLERCGCPNKYVIVQASRNHWLHCSQTYYRTMICLADLLTVAMGSVKTYAAKHGTIIAMRTTHFPRLDNCQESGRHFDVQLGEHMHVAYLNAATRQVQRAS